jgi:hypothetical protein
MTKAESIERLLRLLIDASALPNVFNPWRDVDEEHDGSDQAPEIRTENLRCYLMERVKSARILMIGEAAGYQGAHFSGIAMTSERILLGHKRKECVLPEYVSHGRTPMRTSRESLCPNGFSEPTATIVWCAMLSNGIDPYEFVLWNTFPWHPFNAKRGMLSNRMPSHSELQLGHTSLTLMLHIFRGTRVVALGRLSHATLTSRGVSSLKVRHPANAGATQFRNAISDFLSKFRQERSSDTGSVPSTKLQISTKLQAPNPKQTSSSK